MLRWMLGGAEEVGEGAIEDEGPGCGREDVVRY